MINEFEEVLPDQFNILELELRVEEKEKDKEPGANVKRDPYICVVLQECARMNKLIGEMTRSLAELKAQLEGSLNMSDDMEDLLAALRLNRVPNGWSSNAYPSLKTLAPWRGDLLQRVDQLVEW